MQKLSPGMMNYVNFFFINRFVSIILLRRVTWQLSVQNHRSVGAASLRITRWLIVPSLPSVETVERRVT